jgi:hypothetical protein
MTLIGSMLLVILNIHGEIFSGNHQQTTGNKDERYVGIG